MSAPLPSRRRSWAHVLLSALALTLANAPKPLVIDDATYTRFARQIVAEPTNPFGFDLHWYGGVEPAFEVVATPLLLPYWLAGSMVLVGDDPLAWKLMLFPFAVALAASLRRLLERLAPGLETPLLWMGILSPSILPFVNLMLDVPALSLALLALVLFVTTCDRGGLGGAAAAGLVAAVAMQTKYTAATSLPAMLLWGALFGRWRQALLACGVGLGVFAGWEGLMALRYGQSHFVQGALLSLPARSGISPRSVLAWAEGFFMLIGALGPALCLLGLGALGLSRRTVAGAALAGGLAFAALPFLPAVEVPRGELWPRPVGGPPEQMLFLSLGLAVAASVLGVAWRQLAAHPRREDLFLAGWLAIEIGGFAVLSPFLAARRVMGVLVVALLICGRGAALSPR